MTTMTTAIPINTSQDLLKRKIGMLTSGKNLPGSPNQKKKTLSIPLINEENDFTFAFDYDDDDVVDDDMENFDMIDTSVVNINNTTDGKDNPGSPDDSNDNNNSSTSSNQQQQQTKGPNELLQQSVVPQRKKPGRKPNPASPALRKAQNRAAQRAFRERKERHLRDLENTIQSLRAYQTEAANKFHREREHLQSLIARMEMENNYLKQVVFNFECAINNNEASTKIKNSVMRNFTSLNSLGSNPPTQQSPQQQLQISSINLNLPSPTSSSITPSPETGNLSPPISSPPSTPGSDPLSYIIDKNLLISPRDAKFDASSSPPNNVSSISNLIYQSDSNEDQALVKAFSPSSLLFSQYNNNNNNSNNNNNNITFLPDPNNLINLNSNLTFDTTFFFNSGDLQSINDNKNNFGILQVPVARQSIVGTIGPHALTKEEQQLIRLAKAMGCPDPSVPLKSKVKRKLTPQQEYFLNLPHDRRIDFIPCMHLRSRMIQYQAFYDLYELVELLLAKAKCHGDPADPDSWEGPPEFFERYPFLVFQHCRIKCHFYQKYGELPPNFEELTSTLDDE